MRLPFWAAFLLNVQDFKLNDFLIGQDDFNTIPHLMSDQRTTNGRSVGYFPFAGVGFIAVHQRVALRGIVSYFEGNFSADSNLIVIDLGLQSPLHATKWLLFLDTTLQETLSSLAF